MMFGMFSTCVKYKYRSTSICFHILMLVLIIITFVLPIFLILNSGGFWIHGWSLMEQPFVNFRYKYLLVAERGIDNNPIVCSSLSVYKNNPISDDCILTKIYEVDQNKDGLKDVLHFTTHFRSTEPIKNFQLFVLLGIEFRERKQFSFVTTATLTYAPIHDFQKVLISGDLLLLQKSALREDNFETLGNRIPNHEMLHFQFEESSEIFSAKIANEVVSLQSGFEKDEEVVIECEIFYNEQLIHYKLDTWEIFKWAWIQYVAIVIVFLYVLKLVTSIILQRRIFRGYIIVPWKKIH